MLTTREVIKTFYNALVHKLKKYRGNWDQNDPNATDYIKNRPFYEDKSKKETVVKDTSFMTYGDYDWCSPFIFIPIEGKTYDVFFDGQKYSCTAYKDQYNDLCIGNIYIANDGNGLNTGEPFFYYWYDSSNYGALIQYSGKHTIKVEATKIVKMDKKYLPDNLIPNLALVATSGNYYDLYNIPTIYTDVIRHDFKQTLTLAQKGQARENIGLDEIDYNKLQNKPLGDIFYENITLNNLSIGSRGNLDSNVVFGDASYQCSVIIRQDNGTSLIIDNIEMLLDETKSNDAVYYYTIGEPSPLYTYIKLYFSPSNGFAGIEECWEAYDTVDITIKNVMVKKLIQLAPKFLPDGVPVVPVTNDDNGKILSVSNGVWSAIDFPRKYDEIAFVDQVNGYTYIACMRDGNFVTYCAAQSIEITTMPTKTEYIHGEYFDPTGMVIVATTYDGTTREITDYTYILNYLAEGMTSVEITYTEAGIKHAASVPVTVVAFDDATVLVDFDYIDNGNGTYTITGWKGTYNGEPSTEMIIPNYSCIIV